MQHEIAAESGGGCAHCVCVCALQFVVVVCCTGCGHGVCVWCVVCTCISFTYVNKSMLQLLQGPAEDVGWYVCVWCACVCLYAYMCAVCVCVCVWERESEREKIPTLTLSCEVKSSTSYDVQNDLLFMREKLRYSIWMITVSTSTNKMLQVENVEMFDTDDRNFEIFNIGIFDIRPRIEKSHSGWPQTGRFPIFSIGW